MEVLWSVRETLVEIYLEINNAAGVGRVMAARLGEKDIEAEDVLVGQIDAYLGSEEVEPAAKEALIGILEGIEIAQEAGERPGWAEQVKIWRGSGEAAEK